MAVFLLIIVTVFTCSLSGLRPAYGQLPTASESNAQQVPRAADGTGNVRIHGELKTWHGISLTLDGPYAHEMDRSPNPFLDCSFSVQFTHTDGTSFHLPGYFAADGDAHNSSADAGSQWRVHFTPDRAGQWSYETRFFRGPMSAIKDHVSAIACEPYHGIQGSLQIKDTDKAGRDLRGKGRLQYVGKHHLQFDGDQTYFLKVGADAPETLLAYEDFDNTIAMQPQKAPLKTWSPHRQDWRQGDPTWKEGKGKALIGAINYLSGKGGNAFSFLTYNAGGDGNNVWPFTSREAKLHYDCSKLDQWGIIFEHGTRMGMYLHFKMQETENDDNRLGGSIRTVPESLDGGDLGPERMLYCRELIARFGHNLALNWNLGEENSQSTQQQQAMINYISLVDPYNHPIVVHTFPNEQETVYQPLLGEQSKLTGVSLQNSNIQTTHAQTVKWRNASSDAGKPWVVAFDESGSAAHGQCPDLGYRGFDGTDSSGKMIYTQHEVRKYTLWGHLMGGGAGCEYYFGYKFAENDLLCEDWRSRDQSWDYCRIAKDFFQQHQIPFWSMHCHDEVVGNHSHDNSVYCLALPEKLYLVYLPTGGTTKIDLSSVDGTFEIQWFNPRRGGPLTNGSTTRLSGNGWRGIGLPPGETNQDWLAVLRKLP